MCACKSYNLIENEIYIPYHFLYNHITYSVVHESTALYRRVRKPYVTLAFLVAATLPLGFRVSKKVKRWRVRASDGAFHQEIFKRNAGVCRFTRYGGVG